jgi:CubicO group peptidase (beta-lactamase class C family)
LRSFEQSKLYFAVNLRGNVSTLFKEPNMKSQKPSFAKTTLISLTLAMLVTGIAGCTGNKTETKTANDAPRSELDSATTKASPTFTEPKDWSRSEDNGAITFTAPEGDLSLSLVSITKAENPESAAQSAWKIVDSDFDREVELQTEGAPSRGWDKIWSINYVSSPTEELVVLAEVHQFENQSAVVLVKGHLGTMQKRSAAARAMLNSLKRAGYESEDLSGRTAKKITPEIVNELLTFVKQAADMHQVPGVGIGIIQNGEVVYSGGVGVKDVQTQQDIDSNTRFQIASNTKGMTTLLLAKLVEMGKVSWDDPVIKHYPSFRLGDDETTQSVLIRHLVCACTGLPRKDYEWIFNNLPDTPATAVFEELAATQPTSKFGDIYQYNNQMAAVAGYVAGHIFYPDMEIGAAYDKAMQAYIFDPLNMTETTFSFDKVLSGNVAKPYVIDVDGNINLIRQTLTKGFNHTVTAYRPAGGAWSTTTDMLKYIQNELTAGISANGKRLFAAQPLLERRVPIVETGAGSSYGMGLSNTDMNGIAVVQHGGSMAGYKSQMVMIPSANVGAVILTNSDEGQYLLSAFRRKIIELLYDAEDKAMAQVTASATSKQQAMTEARKDITLPVDPLLLGRLASKYNSPKLGNVEIIVDGTGAFLDSGLWRAPLGSKVNADGTYSLISIGGGFRGGIGLIVGETDGKQTLSLLTPQHSYIFTESN